VRPVIEFSLTLTVHQPEALVEAAQKRAIADGVCASRQEAEAEYGLTIENLGNCVQMTARSGQPFQGAMWSSPPRRRSNPPLPV